MTDLQLGLLAIGVAVVIGVLLYNRIQERSARREAQRAFNSGHADVLLGEGRREPPEPAPAPPRTKAPAVADAMPDGVIHYVMELAPAVPTPAIMVLEAWTPI